MTQQTIEARVVKKLMRNARRVSRQIDRLLAPPPAGWSPAPFDPNELFDAFPLLQLRDGLQLAAYQYYEKPRGYGFVFAIPLRRWLPDPLDIGLEFLLPEDGGPVLRSAVPLPDWVQRDVPRLLEGDGSADSFFQASIFVRELREMGTLRRYSAWANQRILTGADQIAGQNWIPERLWPQEYLPVVTRNTAGLRQVRFLTHTGLRRERILAHQDTFTSGCTFETETTVLARGEGGYIL